MGGGGRRRSSAAASATSNASIGVADAPGVDGMLDVTFPDVHMRMSKKIVQLTNVVVQLHDKAHRSQDSENALRNAYEQEVELILSSAAQKLASFKRELIVQREAGRVEDAVAVLKAEHEDEKRVLMEHMTRLQNEAREEKQRLFETGLQDARGLVTRVTKQAAELEDKVRAFQEALVKQKSDHKLSMGDAARAHEAALERERAKRDAEVKEVLDKSNEEYNTMLTQQLMERDKLRERLEKAREEALEKFKDRGDQQQQSALAELRAQLEKAHAQELETLRNDLTSARDTSVARVQDALDNMRKKCMEESKMRKELETRVEDLTSSCSTMQRRGEAKEATIAELRAAISQLEKAVEHQKSVANENASSASDSNKRLTMQIDDLKSQLKLTEQSLREERDRAARRASADAGTLEVSMRTASEQMNEVMKNHEAERQSLQKQVGELRDALSSAKMESKRLQEQLSTGLRESGDQMQHLSTRYRELERKFEDTQGLLTISNNKKASLALEITSLKEALEEEKQRCADMSKSGGAALVDAQAKWDAERSALEQQIAQLTTDVTKASEDGVHSGKLTAKLQKQLEAEKAEHEKVLAAHQALEKALGDAQLTIDRLNGEIGTLKSSLQKANDKQKELAEKGSRDASDAVDSMRRELENRHSRALAKAVAEAEANGRQNMAAAKLEADRSHREHVAQLRSKADADLKAKMIEWRKQLEQEVEKNARAN